LTKIDTLFKTPAFPKDLCVISGFTGDVDGGAGAGGK